VKNEKRRASKEGGDLETLWSVIEAPPPPFLPLFSLFRTSEQSQASDERHIRTDHLRLCVSPAGGFFLFSFSFFLS